jgi:hypothetical protein
VVDSSIKYGGGDGVIRSALAVFADLVSQIEVAERTGTPENTRALREKLSKTLGELITELEY